MNKFKFGSRINGESQSGPIVIIEQYVSEVLSFSSQYGSNSSVSYTAYNLTGKPSNYPDYGDFPQAFVMRTYGNWWKELPSRPVEYMPQNTPKIASLDYIDVKFERSVYPECIKIYETHNPGAVVRIWAFDDEVNHRKWCLLWEGPPQIVPQQSRIFRPPIKKVAFKTRVLRIEFNHTRLDYYTGLDAVALCGRPKFVSDRQQELHLAEEVIKRNLHSIPFNTQPVDLSEYLMDYMANTAQITVADSKDISSLSFECLPNETILMILSHLDLKSLCNVSAVSHRFRNLARDRLLYTRLSLKPYWHLVSDHFLTDSLQALCIKVQQLDLSWCGSYGLITHEVFEGFLRECCQNLTHIRLNCCTFVRNNTIKIIAQTCPDLQELALRNCLEITEAGFLHLTELANITSLDLYSTYITGPCLVPILEANANLQHLNIGSCSRIDNMDEIARTLGLCNKQLRSLDVWKNTNLSQAGLTALSKCSLLQELDIGWCLSRSLPVESLANLARGCPKLRKLFFTAVRGITDKDLEPFMTNCPDLEQLDLMGVHSITLDGCARLLINLTKLRLLDVSFCYQISNLSVSWMRPHFPDVSIKSNANEADQIS